VGDSLHQNNRSEVRIIGGVVYERTVRRQLGDLEPGNVVHRAGKLLQAGLSQSQHPDDVYGLSEHTDFGRVRTDLNASLSYEFIRDFNTGLMLFDKFDSRPSSTAAAKHDYGLSFTAGWLF
jgi:hypothetical protein